MGSNLVRYTKNPNDWKTGVNGLYIDQESPPPALAGVDLSTSGLLGKTVRGPATPFAVTSQSDFEAVFGGRELVPGGPAYSEVWKAYVALAWGTNIVQRVVASDAAAATHSFSDAVPTAIARVAASSVGVWGNSLQAAIENATDGVSTHFNLRVDWNGAQQLFENVDFTAAHDNSLLLVGDDPSNWIVLTKLADGRPINIVLTALTTGSDGTVTEPNYEAAADTLAAYDGVATVLCVEAPTTPATFNAHMNTAALAHPEKFFLVWSGNPANSRSVEITAKTTQVPSAADNLIWCWNAPKILDPITQTKITLGPHVVLASILSQVDIPVHPGKKAVGALTANLKDIAFPALDFNERKLLRDAGIAALLRVKQTNGYSFRFIDAPSASYTPADPVEAVDVREIMWLIDSVEDALLDFVDEEDDDVRRAQMVGVIDGFSKGLKDANRVIKDYSISADGTSAADRARNIEILDWAVQLIGHSGKIVLRTNMGTGVTVVAPLAQAA